MRFNVSELGFKKYANYSDKELAKAYVVYSINCSRVLTTQEWQVLLSAVNDFTLRKNRLSLYRMWQHDKTIYFFGKQSHGYGYDWSCEIINAFYPILNQFLD